MLHPFRQFIQKFTPVSDADWAQVADCLLRREVPKDTLLLEGGKTCRFLYFLESGLVRFFVQTNTGELTKYFTDIPYCFTSQKSFSQRQPARESIETLEDSIIWQMSYDDAHRLLEQAFWNRFIRLLVQEVQAMTDEILESVQTETAEARYRQMLLENDPLLQRIPLKHLASYLGIAPQSLSRIRKNVMQEQRS